MSDSLLISIWVFGWALIFFVFYRERAKTRRQMHERIHRERMAAIEKGLPYPELPPYVIHEEEDSQMQAAYDSRHHPGPRRMVALGVMLIVTGFGTVTALIISPNESLHKAWTMGLIPVFMGVGGLLGAGIMSIGKRDPK